MEKIIKNIKKKLKFYPGGVRMKDTDRPMTEEDFDKILDKVIKKAKEKKYLIG